MPVWVRSPTLNYTDNKQQSQNASELPPPPPNLLPFRRGSLRADICTFVACDYWLKIKPFHNTHRRPLKIQSLRFAHSAVSVYTTSSQRLVCPCTLSFSSLTKYALITRGVQLGHVIFSISEFINKELRLIAVH